MFLPGSCRTCCRDCLIKSDNRLLPGILSSSHDLCSQRTESPHHQSHQDRNKQMLTSTRDVSMNRTNTKKPTTTTSPTADIAVDRGFSLMRLWARLIQSESFHQNLQQLYTTAQWLFGLRPPTDGHASVVIQRQSAATCENIKVDHRLYWF